MAKGVFILDCSQELFVPTAKFPKDKKPPSVAAQDRLINRMLINRMRRKKFAELAKKKLPIP